MTPLPTLLTSIWLWLLAVCPSRSRPLVLPALLSGLALLSFVEFPERAPVTLPTFIIALSLSIAPSLPPAWWLLSLFYPFGWPAAFPASAVASGFIERDELAALAMLTFAFPPLALFPAFLAARRTSNPLPAMIALAILQLVCFEGPP